jgi:hypothetical protein
MLELLDLLSEEILFVLELERESEDKSLSADDDKAEASHTEDEDSSSRGATLLSSSLQAKSITSKSKIIRELARKRILFLLEAQIQPET